MRWEASSGRSILRLHMERNLRSRRSMSLRFLKSHSHRQRHRHPADFSSERLCSSRSRFLAILLVQYGRLLMGLRAPLAQLWPCQKQPWTKITLRSRGKTRSGVPGRSARWRRYRKPRACTIRRTIISGPVFFPLTACMVRLLSSGDSTNLSLSGSG